MIRFQGVPIHNMAMASPKSTDSSMKILHLCSVSPPSSTINTASSLPLTFFDLMWFKFHPVELLYFYSIPHLHSSLFHDSIVPKLKHSLSLTLQHFLPLAGRIIWPSDSSTPIVQYTPGDAVSLVIAQSDSDFNLVSGNSPREAALSRAFIPHLDSSVSSASVLSLQITLFPNSGFCIGISRHHAVLDGKSASMFMKTWAYLCQTQRDNESPSLPPKSAEPFFDRGVITDRLNSAGLDTSYINQWLQFDPTLNENNKPSLKILHHMFQPTLEQSTRATFELTRRDLEKLKKRVLEKWEENQSADEESKTPPPPPRLSTFVLATAYVSTCIAKAFERSGKKGERFAYAFSVDCRARLGASEVPENYFGNCVMSHIAAEISEEDRVVVVAKKIQNKVKEILEEKGVLEGGDTVFSRLCSLMSEGVRLIGTAGSSRFGVYGSDFGWGRPEKVEITSVDRGLTIGMVESRDGNGGVEVGLVLNHHVMDCFAALFYAHMESL